LAKPAPEYELVLMLDPEAPDERRDEIAVNARRRIEEGATLKQERSWGTRKMSYEINQRNEADYRFFRFEEGKGILDDLNHNLKITDGVLRFRIYKVDPRAPVIDPPAPLTFTAGSDRPGGRSRRDESYEDRPPRAPDIDADASPAPAAPAGEAPPADEAPAPAEAPAEAPADVPEAPADAPGEATEAPAEAPAAAPEAPAEAPEADSAQAEQPAE
jgi:small subunit ribosomal protein S6